MREVLAERVGDVVFGTDDETMEHAVASRLVAQGLTLGVAESLTGGLVRAGWSTSRARATGSAARSWLTRPT